MRCVTSQTTDAPCPRIKGQIYSPICIEARDAITPDSVYSGEEPAHENAIVRFDRKRLNPIVGRRIKPEIERAVTKDACDKGAIDAGVLNKTAAEHDLAVMLQCQRENISTSADTRIE